ncbi:MAG TPA: cation:proton antiporter [Terriglobales bacterium]|nr:cation:proton antiporter [Terriglobales bacterium]
MLLIDDELRLYGAREALPLSSFHPRAALIYLAMLVATVAGYFWIRAEGGALAAPLVPPGSAAAAGAAHSVAVAKVLLALAVIMVAARLLGNVVRRWLGQPQVVGEILAGILLGPSFLGAIAPELQHHLLPPEAAPFLGMISQLGVVLFMFVVGLDLDPRLLRANTHVTLAISHASIVVPFLAGSALALWLYPIYGTANVSFTVFSLFFGVSLSVTAFPVLARILTDRSLSTTPIGAMALACAAVDDVTAWSLLALLAGVAVTDVSLPLITAALVAVYLLAMFLVVRPFYGRLAAREELLGRELSRSTLAWVCAGALLSASATDWIGIHPLFGAFLFGALLPHEGRLATQLRARLEDMVVVLFLPAFFAFTGARTQIGLLGNGADWLFCGVIIAVATAGKFGGSLAAARCCGVGWRESAMIGILMNTRGLMELIVLNVGLELGVIQPQLFTMLVIMALVTTFATSPIFDWLAKPRSLPANGSQALLR